MHRFTFYGQKPGLLPLGSGGAAVMIWLPQSHGKDRDRATAVLPHPRPAGRALRLTGMPPLIAAQITTVSAPVTMPAMAPLPVIRGQNNEKMMMGPKLAPKPAQA